MQHVLDPLDVELDPETQADCDEVCGALEWFAPDDPGSVEYLRVQAFGRKWWAALRHAPSLECRRRVLDALDALERADDSFIRTVQGHIFTRDQLRQYGGRESCIEEGVDSQTGEIRWRWMLEWPTGKYAGGEPSYERKAAA